MDGLRLIILLLSSVLMTMAQRPSFGGCPEKNTPMPDFDLSKFLGVWYEAERSFTIFEAGATCVKNNYTKTSDGKIHVENEIMTLPPVKRVVQGELKVAGKASEGKISIRYALPVPWETTYSILKTDYDNYAVLFNCVSLGIFNAQYAWLMTRARNPPGTIMQLAYGVLDEFDIPRSYFVKTEHKDCDIAPVVPDVVPVSNPPTESPNKKPQTANQKPESSSRTVPEVKTPSNEMLPPEPSDDASKVAMSAEKPTQHTIPLENVEKPAVVVEEVPIVPSEMSQDKAPSNSNVDPEKVSITVEPMAEKPLKDEKEKM